MIVLLIETNTKWTITIKEKIINELKELDKNIEIIFTDSKDYTCIPNKWLPVRIITATQSKIILMIDKDSVTIDKFGKLSAVTIINR